MLGVTSQLYWGMLEAKLDLDTIKVYLVSKSM